MQVEKSTHAVVSRSAETGECDHEARARSNEKAVKR